jgi:hypothetical protein
MKVEEVIQALRAPDQQGTGRVEHLDHGARSLDRLRELERRAVSVWSLDTQVIPGVLQTPAYSAAIIRAANRRLSGDDVRRRMLLKNARVEQLKQRLRGHHPPEVMFVIGELAILRAAHGVADGGQQLRYLMEVARNPRCIVKVLPTSVITPGLTEHYTMYGLWSHDEGRRFLGYVETAMGGWYSTRTGDLLRLHRAWNEAIDLAKAPSASLAFIGEVLEKWTGSRSQPS